MDASSWCTALVFFMVPPVMSLQFVLHERVSVATCSPWRGHKGAHVRSSWRLLRVLIGGQRLTSSAAWSRAAAHTETSAAGCECVLYASIWFAGLSDPSPAVMVRLGDGRKAVGSGFPSDARCVLGTGLIQGPGS